MSFLLQGLAPEDFHSFLKFTDAQLQARGMRRMRADKENSYPCRITLEDALPGEEVLLLPYTHQAADSPYRASGPIFVRTDARRRTSCIDEIPQYLARRILSIRAYNRQHEIIDAEVASGADAAALFERLFDNPEAEYLHVHFARFGCFACRVDRN